MTSYLGAVGALRRAADDVDLDVAFDALSKRASDKDARAVLEAKETLLKRPLARLLANAHVLGGFLGRFDGELWSVAEGAPRFAANPVRFLEELYHFLDLETRADKPPAEQIWSHDAEILETARAFYDEVEKRTGASSAADLDALFAGPASGALCGGDEPLWRRCVASHRGFQLGLELLLIVPRLGQQSAFLEVTVNEELQPIFPKQFLDAKQAAELARALAPPPPAASDEIVTPTGGTFYAREAPHLPPLVEEGQHFEAGQPLFVIEVMKMFNKVLAPFSGTIVKNLMAGRDGSVVKKGEAIFRIEPDERREPETPEAAAKRRRAATLALL
jgi:biotin carboxyl carrier protein